MKSFRIISLSIFFATSVFVGYAGAVTLSDTYGYPTGISSIQTPINPVPPSPLIVNDAQFNSLILIVQGLNREKPVLKNIILAVFTGNESLVRLMFIYPDFDQSTESNHDPLLTAFSLEQDGLPSSEFTNLIKSQDYVWDHLFIFDEKALLEFSELENPDLNKLDSEFGMKQLPILDNSNIGELESIIISCRLFSIISTVDDAAAILDIFSNHMKSDLDPFEILTKLQNFEFEGNSISCSTPQY